MVFFLIGVVNDLEQYFLDQQAQRITSWAGLFQCLSWGHKSSQVNNKL